MIWSEFLANARSPVVAKGSAAAAKIVRLDDLAANANSHTSVVPLWGMAALRGRVVELSASGATATLTSVMELVVEAQTESEPVAWILPGAPDELGGMFYPPDAAECGVDLAALAVIRTSSVHAAGRAAERVLRSGAFGLVVIDFGSLDHARPSASNPDTPVSPRLAEALGVNVPPPRAHAGPRVAEAVLGKLVSLAQAHEAAIVCLTEKSSEAGSLGSLVSLRAEAMRSITNDAYEVSVRALKDKRRGPGWLRPLGKRARVGE